MLPGNSRPWGRGVFLGNPPPTYPVKFFKNKTRRICFFFHARHKSPTLSSCFCANGYSKSAQTSSTSCGMTDAAVSSVISF